MKRRLGAWLTRLGGAVRRLWRQWFVAAEGERPGLPEPAWREDAAPTTAPPVEEVVEAMAPEVVSGTVLEATAQAAPEVPPEGADEVVPPAATAGEPAETVSEAETVASDVGAADSEVEAADFRIAETTFEGAATVSPVVETVSEGAEAVSPVAATDSAGAATDSAGAATDSPGAGTDSDVADAVSPVTDAIFLDAETVSAVTGTASGVAEAVPTVEEPANQPDDIEAAYGPVDAPERVDEILATASPATSASPGSESAARAAPAPVGVPERFTSEPEAPAEVALQPETSAEAASEPETSAEAASEPETSAEAASEPETSAEAASESETIAAAEPAAPSDDAPASPPRPKPVLEIPKDYVPAAESEHELYRIELETFEGPLDLLLFLIRRHTLDIFDIPVAFICERYLHYLKMMEELNLDVASEFLAMAAELLHIKSKMLLPKPVEVEDDEEADPRAELVRRLLEYQKYKDAAERLASLTRTGRDVFGRTPEPLPPPEGPAPLAEVSLFALVEAFDALLERQKPELRHHVLLEAVSVRQRIRALIEVFAERRQVRFLELLGDLAHRLDLVVTFLAILEMARLRLLRVYQSLEGDIHLEGRFETIEQALERLEGIDKSLDGILDDAALPEKGARE